MSYRIETKTLANGKKKYIGRVKVTGFPRKSKTFDLKTDARDWARNTEYEFKLTTIAPEAVARHKTVADMVDLVIAEYVPTLSESNHKSYTNRAIWWKNKIGWIKLDDLNAMMIRHEIDKMKVKPSTKNRHLGSISSMLTFACRSERRWLATNPARGITRWNEDFNREKPQDFTYSPEEIDLLFAAAKRYQDHANSDTVQHIRERRPSKYIYTFLKLVWETGCRLSEGQAARLDQLDPATGRLEIRGKGRNGRAKWRTTFISPELVDEIMALDRTMKDGSQSPWMFMGIESSKKEHNHCHFKNAMDDLLDECGIRVKGKKFHAMRHTAASEVADGGATVQEIMAFTGHTTLVTAARYLHQKDNHVRAAMSKRRRA